MTIDFKNFPEEYSRILNEIYRDINYSENDIERSWTTQFSSFSMAANDKKQWDFDDMVQNIGLLAEKPSFWIELDKLKDTDIHYRIALPEGAKTWGIKFIKQFIKELRLIICNNKKKNKTIDDYKNYPKAVIVALSSSLMAELNITNPMALGLATLILLVLSTATKNAFCNMTDDDVIKSVEKSTTLS